MERERLQGWLQPLHVTQHYLLASVVARISSKDISHHDLLPHAPQVVSSQATADLSLGLLSSLYAPAPAAMCSRALASPSRVCRAVQGLSVYSSFHSDCHRSAAALAPKSGTDPCFSSSTSQVQGPSCSLSPFPFFPLPH